MSDLYIGLMSGTSLDGVDAVLADFSGPRCQVLRHHALGFDPDLRSELLALNTSGADELHRAALAANALARCYAQAVQALLQAADIPASAVQAIGAHGQTVRHRPGAFDGTGYTLQLNNPALLAECTGIRVVADLRSRDVAAGGQGAPLVPAFHQFQFGQPGQDALVLNIGGIANLSVLRADGSVLGFDCGPGNALMDHWCQPGRPVVRCCLRCCNRCRPSPTCIKARPKAPGATCSTLRGWSNTCATAHLRLRPMCRRHCSN